MPRRKSGGRSGTDLTGNPDGAKGNPGDETACTKGGLSLSEYRLGSEKWAKKNTLFFYEIKKGSMENDIKRTVGKGRTGNEKE